MKVVAVAIKTINDGEVFTLPSPARHHTLIKHMRDSDIDKRPFERQGFVLEDGSFVDRKEAGKIAVESGQITHLSWPPKLYSEDLW